MYIPRLFPSSWPSSLFSPNHNHPPTVSPVPSSNCRPTTDPRTLSTLQKLPPEIRLMIKDSIPLTDLRTHVSFYKTSPQFSALYGADEGRQRAFWASACLAVGIGGPPILGDHGRRMGDMCMGEMDWDWRLIAFTCIEVDGWCTHPQCGVSRLEWNAKQIQATMNLPDFSRVAFHKYLQSVCRQDVDPELGVLTSPVFQYVSFHREAKRNIFEDALLDYRDGDLANEENPANLLVKHPIASWSFATFPVVHTLFMENRFYTQNLEMDWIGVQNANGVTVFDVMNHIFWRTCLDWGNT
ncbi:hypothetical protein K474DRAFT_1408365 [Panus rudis PR-1116 ss-1]|nr:hypothetical protein K474DRAFT_1408365 [Panus rudis PR-1116 ss-1]